MNADAGFVVASKIAIISDGLKLATDTINNGRVSTMLDHLVGISNG